MSVVLAGRKITVTGKEVESLKDGLGRAIIPLDVSTFEGVSEELLHKRAEELKITDLVPLMKAVEGVDKKLLTPTAFSIFDYQGFDPIKIMKVLKVYQDYYKMTESAMVEDLTFCCAIPIYMGNVQSKALTRRSLEGRLKVEYLCLKYGILRGTTNTGIDGYTLTFPRIGATFASMSVKIAMQCSPKSVGLEFKSHLVPSCLRLNPAASMFPMNFDEPACDFILTVIAAHAADMQIAYTKGAQKKAKVITGYDAKSIALDQWPYIESASASPFPIPSVKREIITLMDLQKHYKNMVQVYKRYKSIVFEEDEDGVEVLTEKEFADSLKALSGKLKKEKAIEGLTLEVPPPPRVEDDMSE